MNPNAAAPEAAAEDRETPLECEAEKAKKGKIQTDHDHPDRTVSRLHPVRPDRP